MFKDTMTAIFANVKFYFVIVVVGVAIFFGLSKVTLQQEQRSTQNVTTTQLVQNQNINFVYAGQSWLVTNEAWAFKEGGATIEFINTLNYYQQTRMHVLSSGVFYPIIPVNTIKIVTNFVSNQNFNTNSIKIEPKFNLKKLLPWNKK